MKAQWRKSEHENKLNVKEINSADTHRKSDDISLKSPRPCGYFFQPPPKLHPHSGASSCRHSRSKSGWRGWQGGSWEKRRWQQTRKNQNTHIYIGRCPGSAFVLQTIKTPHRAFLTTCFQIFCPPPLIGSIFFSFTPVGGENPPSSARWCRLLIQTGAAHPQDVFIFISLAAVTTWGVFSSSFVALNPALSPRTAPFSSPSSPLLSVRAGQSNNVSPLTRRCTLN